MNFIRQLFIWWRGQTLATRLMTFFTGRRAGRDEAGNVYYHHRTLSTKRWVIYRGIVDASKVPAEWHAWLHNMRRNAPRADAAAEDRAWFRPHRANMTGTKMALTRRPHLPEDEAQAVIEYEAWKPIRKPKGKPEDKSKGKPEEQDHAG